MTNRRDFLVGCLAASAIPRATWADVGQPVFLSAAERDGTHVLCGISAKGDITFEIPIPARGHAAAAHPTRPEAVAFARRPGDFAVVLDCQTGAVLARISSPAGRHFYGHGVFSADARYLFTTENDYEAARGVIGVWDSERAYARVGEFDSGGVGPHDIRRLPNSDILVVANGGIETHPDSGRSKLNIPFMEPNLTYIENGKVVDTVTLGRAHQFASIRHLSVADDGRVAFAMQWEGGTPSPALVGIHKRGQTASILTIDTDNLRAMNGYVASIAFDQRGDTICVTCPRGGVVQIYDAAQRTLIRSFAAEDIGGVAPHDRSFITSSGDGAIVAVTATGIVSRASHKVAWDNHLVSL